MLALSEEDMWRAGTHNLRCGRLARMAKDSLMSHQSRLHDAAGVRGEGQCGAGLPLKSDRKKNYHRRGRGQSIM